MSPADTETNTGAEPMAVDAPDSESPSAATEPQQPRRQPPSKAADADADADADSDDPVPIETQTDRYLVLVEFVYRHLNFQMAELKSILETYGIRLGTRGSRESKDNDDDADDEMDCRLVALPVPDAPTCSESPVVVARNRAFCILSFPSDAAGRWSGLLQSPEDQRRNSRFEPEISAPSTAATTGGGGGGASSDSLSIADVLYKCTLVKSVVELWGYSSVSLEDCADRTLRWLHDGTHDNNDNNNNDSNDSTNHHTNQEESFQKKHVWPSICRDTERPWKFTIHTLGMKVRREEQDAMRQTFRSTLDCIEGPVRLKDPASQEFLLIREIELDGRGSPLWKADADADAADETKAIATKTATTATATATTTTETTKDATATAMTIAEGSGNNSSNDNDNTNTNTNSSNKEQNPITPSGGKTNNNNNNNNNSNNNSSNSSNQTPRTGKRKEFCTDAIAYYFGRVLGGRQRSSDGSRGIDHYSLKSRPYLGPTSMDAELSFVMTSLGRVTKGTLVFDPFVGTGSILLSCALRGAHCFGTDIDIRVLRGKGGNQTIWKNFDHYGLPRPEIVRSDNALYHRHYRHHHHHRNDDDDDNDDRRSGSGIGPIATPLYDAILCDPPYGIRAGARQTGSKLDDPRPVLEENRHDHIAQTKPYVVSDVMSDLLDVAARTLVRGGRLVYVIPSFRDFDEDRDLPRHDCLELVHSCYQPFTHELGRRIVAMVKVSHYRVDKREDYRATIWRFGAESAEKCANLREKIAEAAREKPGYEEKAAIRKEKRKANKEAKKKEKRARKRLLEEQQQQQQQQKQQEENQQQQEQSSDPPQPPAETPAASTITR